MLKLAQYCGSTFGTLMISSAFLDAKASPQEQMETAALIVRIDLIDVILWMVNFLFTAPLIQILEFLFDGPDVSPFLDFQSIFRQDLW